MAWTKKILDWTDGGKAFVSVVFTWQLPDAWSRCVWYREQGYQVQAGGPAVSLFPEYLSQVASVNGLTMNALPKHNSQATRFSTGCVNHCPFCAVPTTEGDLQECEGEAKPIVCDNNLLACSKRHFDHVIDLLKPVPAVDMNQGLDCRIITPYHVDRLRELNLHCIRFAWDNIKEETKVRDAVNLCLKAGIPKSKVRVYVLVGYHDTPDDAMYRMQTLKSMGLRHNSPMRYQEFKGDKALIRDSYLEPSWTEYEMHRFIRYWFRQNWFSKVPYADWRG